MFGFGKGPSRETIIEGLRKSLLAVDGSRKSPDAKNAIAYCEYCIRDYEYWFTRNQRKWLLWQKVVIIGGVVATLAGVITLPEGWVSGLESFAWVRGVPAALVTIAAGFLSSFTYRDDAVRNELA